MNKSNSMFDTKLVWTEEEFSVSREGLRSGEHDTGECNGFRYFLREEINGVQEIVSITEVVLHHDLKDVLDVFKGEVKCRKDQRRKLEEARTAFVNIMASFNSDGKAIISEYYVQGTSVVEGKPVIFVRISNRRLLALDNDGILETIFDSWAVCPKCPHCDNRIEIHQFENIKTPLEMAKSKSKFIKVSFSDVELRILAKATQEDLQSDVVAEKCSEVFGVKKEDVTYKMRHDFKEGLYWKLYGGNVEQK